MFQTVIFDLDGTLLDTLSDLTNAVNYVLERYGYPLRSKAEIRRFLGNGARNLIQCALPEAVDAETFEKILSDYIVYYNAHAQIFTAPYEGVETLLATLQSKGIAVAVVSNKGDEAVKALVGQYFPSVPVVIGERKGVRRKPAPDSLLEAMRELNANPETTVLVGDSEVDALAAKNAGIAWAAAGWGFRDKDELLAHNPAVYLTTPRDFPTESEI